METGRIDIRSIRDVPKLLGVMRDGRVLARGVKPPFMRAVFALSSVVEMPGRDGAGARVFWFTPNQDRGRVFFALSPMRMNDRTEGAYLDHFFVPEPGKGAGGKCLRMLCELADFHGATLCLNAEPEGDKPLDGARLQAWYERHGFVFSEGIGPREQRGAVRKPRGRSGGAHEKGPSL